MQYVGNGLRALGRAAVVGAAALALAAPAYGQSNADNARNRGALNVYMKGNTICEEYVIRPDDMFTGACTTTYADGLQIRRIFVRDLPFGRRVSSPENWLLHLINIKTLEDHAKFMPEFDPVLKDVVQPEYCVQGRCKVNK